MKKSAYLSVIFSLVAVFAFSYLCTQFVLPIINGAQKAKPVYSETMCVTDQVTQDMSIYDIAKLYRDSNATIQVMGEYYSSSKKHSCLGSGVVIASTGYETTTLDENISASQGSYIATNYHVIDLMYNSAYSNKSLKVRAEDEVEYDCEVLWYNKNFDLAILYAEVSYDYVKMADRWIYCEDEYKLDYEPAFAIGSPLEKQNLNRLTIGNIASNNEVMMFTSETIYVNSTTSPSSYSTERSYSYSTQYSVLDNIYEDVIDITVGISGGNSGGGLFDERGNLLGLTTLSTPEDESGGNQINGAVAIYPIMKVLDRVIANNETSQNNKIYSLSTLGLVGLDKTEAEYATEYKGNASFYFLNEKLYDSYYSSYFNFSDEGFRIISNSNNYLALSGVSAGSVIRAITTADGIEHEVNDRNDLLYAVMEINEGDNIIIKYENNGIFGTSTHTASFVA